MQKNIISINNIEKDMNYQIIIKIKLYLILKKLSNF